MALAMAIRVVQDPDFRKLRVFFLLFKFCLSFAVSPSPAAMATAAFSRLLLRRASPSSQIPHHLPHRRHQRHHHHHHHHLRRIHGHHPPSSDNSTGFHRTSAEENTFARAIGALNGPHNCSAEIHVLTSAEDYRKMRREFSYGSCLSLQRNSCGMPMAFARSFSSRSQNRNTGSRPVQGRPMHDVRDSGDAKEEAEHDHTKDDSDIEDDYEDEQILEDDEEEEDEDEEEQGSSQSMPAKKKPDKKYAKPTVQSLDQQGRVLNDDITAETVRLVIDGEGHRIVSRKEALHYAKERGLDLVQVDGKSKPPVCKVFNFHKEEYRQEQIQKDRKKKKVEMLRLNDIKELRFTSKTERKDVQMKVDKAKTFMDRGHRVKFVAIFKGPDDEKKRAEQEKMINEIINMVEDTATIDQGPRIEARQAWVMLRHVKFGVAKKKAPQTSKLQAVNQDAPLESTVIKQALPGSSHVVEDSNLQDRMSWFEEEPSDANTIHQDSRIPFQSPSTGSRYSAAPGSPVNTRSTEKGIPMAPSESPIRSGQSFSQSPRLSPEGSMKSPQDLPRYPTFKEQKAVRLPSDGPSMSTPKFPQSPRMSENGTQRILSEDLTRHPPRAASPAQHPEEEAEAYGTLDERFSQPLYQAVESGQSVGGKSGYTVNPKLPQIPQGRGQGIPGLSSQGHAQGAPGISSQGRGQGAPGISSQGRGQGVPGASSQGRGIGLSLQDRGHVEPGLPSQGRGKSLDSPLLDFFASPESTPQPSQGSSSSRVVPQHTSSIGQPRYPSQGPSSKFDQGAEGYKQRKIPNQPYAEQESPNAYGSRHQDDVTSSFQGQGRGSVPSAQGRGPRAPQGQGYPRYPSSSPPHVRKPRDPAEAPANEYPEDQHPPSRNMGRGGGRK